MKAHQRELARLVLLGILLVALLAFAEFQAGGGSFGRAADAAPNSPAAMTPGQQAAIDGAMQLLLLQPQIQTVYLPLVLR